MDLAGRLIGRSHLQTKMEDFFPLLFFEYSISQCKDEDIPLLVQSLNQTVPDLPEIVISSLCYTSNSGDHRSLQMQKNAYNILVFFAQTAEGERRQQLIDSWISSGTDSVMGIIDRSIKSVSPLSSTFFACKFLLEIMESVKDTPQMKDLFSILEGEHTLFSKIVERAMYT